MMRPSSLPMLRKCPSFASDQTASEYADEGTQRHSVLAAMLSGLTFDELDDESMEGVDWARQFIKAACGNSPAQIEMKRVLLDDEMNVVMAGTPDVTSGNMLFDFKWRERDYEAQMAAYALMMMQDDPRIEIVYAYVLFGAIKKVVEYRFTLFSASELVFGIIDKSKSSEANPCEYCGWCANRLTCPAVLNQVETVAKGYSDDPLVQQWHPSKMDSPEEIAAALRICRTIVKKWCDSIEYHAFQAATKQGMALPGFKLKERKGRKRVDNVVMAFGAIGLPQEIFLECCDVRLNTSKKYPDRKGLDVAIASMLGLRPGTAKKEVLKRLENVITYGKPSMALVSENDQEEEGDE